MRGRRWWCDDYENGVPTSNSSAPDVEPAEPDEGKTLYGPRGEVLGRVLPRKPNPVGYQRSEETRR